MNRPDLRHNNFDLIRLLAAFQVAFGHITHHLKIDAGALLIGVVQWFPGVPIFFVMSGFLISASYERASSTFEYLRNRVLRIYPALWVCLSIAIATAWAFGGVSFFRKEALPWLAGQLTVAQFYNPEFLRTYGTGTLDGSLWTIPIELQFYLILPALYSMIRWSGSSSDRFLLVSMVPLVVVNLLYCYFRLPGVHQRTPLKLFGVTVLPFLYMFLLGILAQRNFTYLRTFIEGKALYWVIAFVALNCVFSTVGIEVRGNYLNPVSAVMLAIVTLSAAYTRPSLSALLKGNDLSYGTYIYHCLVINVFLVYGLARSWVYLWLALAFTLVAAWLSWRLIEQPALQLKHYSLRADSPVERTVDSRISIGGIV